MSARDELSEDEAHAFLSWPDGYELPGEEALFADARAILQSNAALDRELAPRGVLVSPVWEEHDGQTVVRLAALPHEFRGRYHDEATRQALLDRTALQFVADVAGVFADDPVGATLALENTQRTWWDEAAPTRVIAPSYKGHLRLLSLVLADVGRKLAAGFSTIEICASYGMLSMVHDPDRDPPVDTVKAAMRDKTKAMWAAEDGWKKAALARRRP